MTLLHLVAAFIRRRPAAWILQVLTLALGVTLIATMALIEQGVTQRFARDLAGIDLVIGAKGSPLQIVLSSVFEMDTPTGNIPLAEAQRFQHHYLVKAAVPVSLGDSVGGYRIVGTSPAFADLYGARLRSGRWWTKPLEAVVGAAVARRLDLKLGSSFVGQHGLSGGGELHKDSPYRVVGILEPTGSIPDRLALTDTSSVWLVHDREALAEGGLSAGSAARPREVTALLVKYRSPMGTIILPPLVKATPNLQPASPAVEVVRLVRLLGLGADVVAWLGLALLILSSASFLVSLMGAVTQRRRELALLRALGARPILLLELIAVEAAALGLAAGLIGVGLSRLLLYVMANLAERQGMEFAAPAIGWVEISAILGALLLALLAALPPAWIAAQTDPSRELASV